MQVLKPMLMIDYFEFLNWLLDYRLSNDLFCWVHKNGSWWALYNVIKDQSRIFIHGPWSIVAQQIVPAKKGSNNLKAKMADEEFDLTNILHPPLFISFKKHSLRYKSLLGNKVVGLSC